MLESGVSTIVSLLFVPSGLLKLMAVAVAVGFSSASFSFSTLLLPESLFVPVIKVFDLVDIAVVLRVSFSVLISDDSSEVTLGSGWPLFKSKLLRSDEEIDG